MSIHPDFSLQSYAFSLPEKQIAQHPAPERAASRLMVLDRAAKEIHTGQFSDILRYLPPRCLLVANNSRVIPARLEGERISGGKVEMLPLTPLPILQVTTAIEDGFFHGWNTAEAEVLLKPAKKIHPGDILNFAGSLTARMLERGPFGRSRVRLYWQGDIKTLFGQHGLLPLPPYIKRGSDVPGGRGAWGTDAERYQTIYAREDKTGSVAAPTAGLHFTPELCAQLLETGREWAEVTLYVGYGTFSPVRCDDIREHQMHAEYVEIPHSTAEAVTRAKAEGRPVIAVGTTACRTLEGVFSSQASNKPDKKTSILSPHTGWINIFLYPGKSFQVIDGLITNFHLPESSLLMLVSAFAGRERALSAYRQAVDEQFRFFSYGDSMLIL